MQVVSTSALPIDLAAQVIAALPGAVVHVPAQGHVGVANVDLREADALVCLLLDRIDANLLSRAPRLRVVANCAVGFDNVDVAAMTAAGVVVTNTPDVLTEATAELAFALLMACARRIGEGERLVRSRAWKGWALDQLIGVGLLGKTLGIVGFGRIGQALARRALGFGMRVIYADLGAAASAPMAGDVRQVGIDELFATADAISLHCPLVPATRHLVNADRLAQMKPTAILINTARGGLMDYDCLEKLLIENKIYGAGLDVFPTEPFPERPLKTLPNVVLTPHIGFNSTAALERLVRIGLDNILNFFAGKPQNLIV